PAGYPRLRCGRRRGTAGFGKGPARHFRERRRSARADRGGWERPGDRKGGKQRARRRRQSPARASFEPNAERADRKSTRLNSSHVSISYAVFCLKKKKKAKLNWKCLMIHVSCMCTL